MANVPHSLSVCMIVKNEASNIREALESFAAFADEIVVVDTGSTDGTPNLALAFTPHVYHYTWHDDFSAARNFSLEKAGCAYCLWMDADDRIDALNAAKINALKREFDGRRAFAFELHDIRNGAPFRSLMQIRCIPNRQDVRFQGRIHESIDWDRVQDELIPVNVDIVVTHHGYDDPVLLGRKINRNIRLLQMECEAGRDDATLHYYLAMSFSHIGNRHAAIDHMGRALRDLEKRLFHAHGREAETLRTFRLDAQLFLVQEMLGLERRGDARRLLARLSCEPELDPLSLFRIGGFYQSLNAHEEALPFFARVDPDKQTPTALPSPRLRRTDVVARIALSLFCSGRRDQALDQIRSLSDPVDRKEAWEIVGILAAETGRYRLGAMAFEQALGLGELTASGWEQWGVIWDRIGGPRRAEQCWRKALQMDGGAEGAAIHLANLLWRENRKDEAFQIFGRLVRNGCCKVPVLLAYGVMACERKDEGALTSIRENLEVFLHDGKRRETGTPPSIFLSLARHLEDEGKEDLARLARRLARWEKSVGGQAHPE